MNKLINKIAVLFLGMIVAVGVGVAVGNTSKASPVKAASDTLAMSALESSDDNIRAVAAKSTGSNVPITATVNSQSGVRMYANNTLTITSSQFITSLTIPWYKNGSKTFASVTVVSGGGTYTHAASSGNSGTWTGSSKEIVLKIGSSGQIQLYQIQYVTDIVKSYADHFLETLSTGDSAVCQYDEQTHTISTNLTALQTAWKTLADEYASGFGLTDDEKEQFRTGTTNESGTTIQKALALYDHIATAYGHSLQSAQLTNFDFMSRGITPANERASNFVTALESNNAVTIVIIISTISVTAIGGYIFIRRRKSDH